MCTLTILSTELTLLVSLLCLSYYENIFHMTLQGLDPAVSHILGLFQNGVGDTLPTQNNLGTLVLFVRH